MNPSKFPERGHRHRAMLSRALLVALGAIAPLAIAAPAPPGHAYRCKQADGSLTYGQMPCSAQAELIKASDARTASQLRQSLINDDNEVSLAARMTRERRHAERVAAEQHAQALTRPARRHATQLQAVASPGSVTPLTKPGTSTYKPHGHRHFRAVVPKSAQASTGVSTINPVATP